MEAIGFGFVLVVAAMIIAHNVGLPFLDGSNFSFDRNYVPENQPRARRPLMEAVWRCIGP
jgi:hypothetical protein